MVKLIGKSHRTKNNLRDICKITDINTNETKSFSILNGTGKKSEIAVFHISGKYYAISNRCKHIEDPLSEGELNHSLLLQLHHSLLLADKTMCSMWQGN
jgi:nitrite reductase/ring-hydroxylating ferredoxin subunit